jgi:two-component system response regulator BaeR
MRALGLVRDDSFNQDRPPPRADAPGQARRESDGLRPRRTQLGEGPASPLELDEERMQLRVNGTRLELTPVEFRLLGALAARPGRVLSRSRLIDALYLDRRVVSDRTVDSHVKNLRRKIAEANGGADPVASVYGLGYKLEWEQQEGD